MKISLFKSLKFRLPFLVLLGVVPTAIGAIVLASSSASTIIRQETKENLSLKAQALESSVTRWTNMNVLAIQNLSKQPAIMSMEPKQQKPILMQTLDSYKHLYTASTTDLNGINVTRSDDKAPKKYPDRPWFQGAKAGNDITYQTLIGRTSKKPSLCLSVPIKANTIIQGVNYICMTLETLVEEIGNAKFGETGYALIVNEQGRVLAHPDPKIISGNELSDFNSYPPVANLLAGKPGYFPFTDEAGVEWISQGTRLNNGWGILILQKKSEAFLRIKEFQQLGTLIAGALIIVLGILTWLLARRITKPIGEITSVAINFAAGDLNQNIDLQQDNEIGVLADAFNKIVREQKGLIKNLENQAYEQRREKEVLEKEILTLISEVGDATEGDLTVRASLESLQLSTVSDLFNAIIDNLQEIAIEAKDSSSKVGSSLQKTESEILKLAEQAMVEAKETRDSLASIEFMSQSIQTVAENAKQAEQIANDTFNTVLNSSSNMDLTVNSILALRETVGNTANRMKVLGESSEKIAQAVSFIEEIAFKTNVLAINASVEADRAGEYGKGFIIIAEQVGALAKQSTTATKEISNIATAIQFATEEVSQAMTSGNNQVIESARLVEASKESLEIILEKSQNINQLMESVSQATESQTGTSRQVNNLMEKIALLSESTAESSTRVAQSVINTAEVAQKLESTVAQFKVAESS